MAKCEHRKGYDNATCILCEIDRLKKTIQSLQDENDRLRNDIIKIEKNTDFLADENARLRVIEEKARAVVKTMVCHNTELEDFEGICNRVFGCEECELKALEDALKGGADNADRLQD